jgi:hypothetical protein
MSSQICSGKHFATLRQRTKQYVRLGRFCNTELSRYGITGELRNQEADDAVIDDLFDNLQRANVLTFKYKYDLGEPNFDENVKAEIEYLKQNNKNIHTMITPLGYYNGLRCLSYQLEMEHIEGIFDDLFYYDDFLQVLINATANWICLHLPDDETNKWAMHDED